MIEAFFHLEAYFTSFLASLQLARIQNDDAELSPSEFLPKQKAYLESKLALTRKEMEVKNFEAEILTFSHFR